MAALAQAPVAKLDHLGEVVARVDVHHGEGQRQRGERLLRHAQQRDRVLAAAEQEHRPGQLGDNFADHERGFGLECAKL